MFHKVQIIIILQLDVSEKEMFLCRQHFSHIILLSESKSYAHFCERWSRKMLCIFFGIGSESQRSTMFNIALTEWNAWWEIGFLRPKTCLEIIKKRENLIIFKGCKYALKSHCISYPSKIIRWSQITTSTYLVANFLELFSNHSGMVL